MKLFGVRRRKRERYNKFIGELNNQADSYLFMALDDLTMRYEEGECDEYTLLKLRAVEDEIIKRGHVDDTGHIIIPSQYY